MIRERVEMWISRAHSVVVQQFGRRHMQFVVENTEVSSEDQFTAYGGQDIRGCANALDTRSSPAPRTAGCVSRESNATRSRVENGEKMPCVSEYSPAIYRGTGVFRELARSPPAHLDAVGAGDRIDSSMARFSETLSYLGLCHPSCEGGRRRVSPSMLRVVSLKYFDFTLLKPPPCHGRLFR